MAADPVVSPAASAVAVGLSSGLVGAVLVQFGITWPLLAWAACGCVVGLSWSPAVGRIRAGVLFIAASLLSAKAGAYFSPSDINAAQGIAACLGVFLHPIATALAKALPAAVERRVQ
jgi:hypothetical protein